MPTCLELAGADYPSSFQGRDLIPLVGESFVSSLRGAGEEGDSPRVIAWPKAVRQGDWKLVYREQARDYLVYELDENGLVRSEFRKVPIPSGIRDTTWIGHGCPAARGGQLAIFRARLESTSSE